MKYHIIKKETENDKQPDYIASLPSWKMDDIILSQSITTQLYEVKCFIENYNLLLHDWNFNTFMKGSCGLVINFYGMPGTGKTITADALASMLNKNIIKVTNADIESRYLGGTSKNLQSLFIEAKENNNVLFFDEADAIVGRRMANVSHAAEYGINAAKSTLLTLLDSYSNVVIFATNLFENYDSAFLRRILFHIEFVMPNISQREKIWELHLTQKIPKTISYREAAELSDGLSGGDIRNLSIRLALQILTKRISSISMDTMISQIDLYKKNIEAHKKQQNCAIEMVDKEEVLAWQSNG